MVTRAISNVTSGWNGARSRRGGLFAGLLCLVAVTACSNAKTPTPTVSSPATSPLAATPSPAETRFAGGQSSALNIQTSPTTSSPVSTSNPGIHYVFNGRPYAISAAITEISPTALENGCEDDAAPGSTNINFTVTVTNLQTDRSAIAPTFTVGTISTTNPGPKVDFGTANLFADSTSCAGAISGPQGENLDPGGSYTYYGQISGLPTANLATTDLGVSYNSTVGSGALSTATNLLRIPLDRP